MTEQQCCGNCQFWRPEYEPEYPRGFCRKNAPVASQKRFNNDKHPRVEATEWCGEWRVRTTRELSAEDRETLERVRPNDGP